MENDKFFFDTCSLLLAGESLFEKEETFVISSITFKELERIKTSSNKDPDVKYSARLLLRLFEEHPEAYEVIIHKQEYEDEIINKSLEVNDDTRILSDAIWCNNNLYVDRIKFITNDLSLKHIANLFFGDGMIDSVPEDTDDYTGYKEIIVDEAVLALFYKNSAHNYFNLRVNEYLILKNYDGDIIDIRKWDGNDHKYLNTKPINSAWFGKVTPYNDDIYQKLLFDSLKNNKITLVKGPAGSGKTIVSLAYLMSQVENHNLDKIIVFCNTVATANSAKLGYYPGTKDQKLLDSQIGNLLASKFGGRDGVEQLMNNNKLVLLPLSDIRGLDTTGMKAGVYISEAQNLDRSLMKLALQRIGEDCICIIDGDVRAQVDSVAYSGQNSGMKRASKIFRGSDIYGEVELKNIWRSQIANLAEKM